MCAFLQKTLLLLFAGVIGYFSSKIDCDLDFLWSIRSLIIPVLMTMMTLYTTLSLNLVKALYDVSDQFREAAYKVLDAMRLEMRIELFLLFLTFLLMILYPFFNSNATVSLWGRCLIDSLIVIDIINFIIAIIDTFFGYLDLVKAQR